MKKQIYVLTIVLAVAFFLRFYPLLISGMPFSTDGWSSIRNTELLIQNSPVSLSNNSLFDGYNNYWPANSIFGAAFSEITGISPVTALAIAIPLAGAFAIPLFYVLSRRITENKKIALVSTALLATAYPYTLFTAGVTKETFANPLFVSLILIFLLAPTWKRTILFSVASAALVLSHHLATFVTIGVLVFLTIALFFSKNKRFLYSVKGNVGLLLIICGLAAAYFGFFAYGALSFSLAMDDLLVLGTFTVLVLFAVLFFVAKKGFVSRKWLIFRYILIFVIAFCALFFLTKKALYVGAPVLPLHYFLYGIPYLILLPLLPFGFRGLHERRSSLLLPVFWLVPLIGLEGFALFSASSIGLTLAYRMLNFLVLPLFILAGIVFTKLYEYSKNLRNCRIVCAGVIGVVLLVASLNSYSMFASVSLQEPYMGYFWLYRAPENFASSWIASHSSGLIVAGDMKVSYLLNGYYGVRVDAVGGYKFLENAGSKPALLFVYPEMSTNGYVLYGGNPFVLPENWKLNLNQLNHVYSNNIVNLYAK